MMRGLRIPSIPIFWQTLLLLFAAVFAVQFFSIAIFLSQPIPRADFNRLSDIAETLAGRRIDRTIHVMVLRHRNRDEPRLMPPSAPDTPLLGPGRAPRERALHVTFAKTEPVPLPGMIANPQFSRRLAALMEVDPATVRLYYEPDQHSNVPWIHRRNQGDVLIRRGEPIFFDLVIAGVRTPEGWRVVQTPPRAWLAPWQRRMLIFFLLSAVALTPLAWLFARRLTRPIRRIAQAADRMGGNPHAPPIAEDGPSELRRTAHALNRMQDRLSAYLAERTNMIGAIAHDLRTPLARIAFRIEGAPEDVRQKVQGDIEQMRAMIAATISFVRDTTRITAMQPVAFDAVLADLAAAEQEQGHKVSVAALAPLTIMGDISALRRMVQNLIDNGVAYGGEVELSLSAVDGEAELRVSDRGPGLPEAALEAMFKPFERGEPSRNRTTGGIGLGLSIARGDRKSVV
jgi:signal transduction histidine kinase